MIQAGTSFQVIHLHRSQAAKYLGLCTAVSKITEVNVMSRKYARIYAKRQMERYLKLDAGF